MLEFILLRHLYQVHFIFCLDFFKNIISFFEKWRDFSCTLLQMDVALGLLLSFNVAIVLPFIVPLVCVSYQNASTVLVFFVLAFSVASVGIYFMAKC